MGAGDIYIRHKLEEQFRQRNLQTLIDLVQSREIPLTPADFAALQRDKAMSSGVPLSTEELDSRVQTAFPQTAPQFSPPAPAVDNIGLDRSRELEEILGRNKMPEQVPLHMSVNTPSSMNPPTRTVFSKTPDLGSDPFPVSMEELNNSLQLSKMPLADKLAIKMLAPLGLVKQAGVNVSEESKSVQNLVKDATGIDITASDNLKDTNVTTALNDIALKKFDTSYIKATQAQREEVLNEHYLTTGVGTGTANRIANAKLGKNIWDLKPGSPEFEIINSAIEADRKRLAFETALLTGQASVTTELDRRLTSNEALGWYLPKEKRRANALDTPKTLREKGAIAINDKEVPRGTQLLLARQMIEEVDQFIEKAFPPGMDRSKQLWNAATLSLDKVFADEKFNHLDAVTALMPQLIKTMGDTGNISSADRLFSVPFLMPSLISTYESAKEKTILARKMLEVFEVNIERTAKGMLPLTYDQIKSGEYVNDMDEMDIEKRLNTLREKKKNAK